MLSSVEKHVDILVYLALPTGSHSCSITAEFDTDSTHLRMPCGPCLVQAYSSSW